MKLRWILLTMFVCLIFSGLTLNAFKKKSSPSATASQESSITWSDKTRAEEIKKIIEGFEIQTLFDADARNFDAFQQLNLHLKRYIGASLAKEQVDTLRLHFGSATSTFFIHDMTCDPLPQVDLVLCWDRLNTLTHSQRQAALVLIKKSGARFILLAHDREISKNHKSKQGELQPINWELPPYHFPKPLIEILRPNERSLALWTCDTLP